MILKRLTLEGVGPYAGRETLEIATDAKRPVTLIGGLNGAGKTTLIRSLFHVLYGARSLSELGSQRSYRAYLAETIHRDRDDAAVELTLAIPGLREGAELTVRRRWRKTQRGGAEVLDVFVGEHYDEELSESWDETIEQIAPLGVARLFFFDGEKIEALADLDSAAESLRTAVGSLLGLDLVEQLQSDLLAVQRRVLRTSENTSSQELEKREAALAAADDLATTVQGRVEELERALLGARENAAKLESASRAAGGDLVADRERLEAEADAARRAEAGVWEQLRELASDPLGPLSLLGASLTRLTSAAEQHGQQDSERRVLAMLAERDTWILEQAKRLDLKSSDKLADLLAGERRERAARTKQAGRFVPQTPPETISAITTERLTSWRVAALGMMDGLDEASAATEDIDRRISKIPNDESVGMLIDAVAVARQGVEELANQLQEQQQLFAAAQSQVAGAREHRDREIARLAEVGDGRERQQRLTQHAERAKATLGLLRSRVAERHVGRIADYTMQCLEQLLRKERLIVGVTIDPESFAVTLAGAGGEPLRPAALSAGERQLTALALLWALARAAGLPLPVVIDTPLGRLDADHRRHVVERYLPAASHQVIVLSTDTEIEGELHAALKPSLGAQHQLRSDHEGRSVILDGYLELTAA